MPRLRRPFGLIEPPFIIFQNKISNFPIQGVRGNVLEISYRTGKKKWIDQRVMALILSETRFFKRRADRKKQLLFVDNVGSHNLTPELIKFSEDCVLNFDIFLQTPRI